MLENQMIPEAIHGKGKRKGSRKKSVLGMRKE